MHSYNSNGFTLIETMITIAIISILVMMATSGADYIQAQKLTSTTREFLADLQQMRQNALTKRSTAVNSRGFGVRFNSNTTYTLFEFNDANGNFAYDAGEESGATQKNLQSLPGSMASSVTVTIGAAGDPTGAVLLYDKHGMPRTTAWGIAGSTTYVLKLASGSIQSSCVLLNQVRVREGRWNGVNCAVR